MSRTYKIVSPSRYRAKTLGTITMDDKRQFTIHLHGAGARRYPLDTLKNAAWLADKGLSTLPDRPFLFFFAFFLCFSIIGGFSSIVLTGYVMGFFIPLIAALAATIYIILAPTHNVRLSFTDNTEVIARLPYFIAASLVERHYKLYTPCSGWRKYERAGSVTINARYDFSVYEDGREDGYYALTDLQSVQWVYNDKFAKIFRYPLGNMLFNILSFSLFFHLLWYFFPPSNLHTFGSRTSMIMYMTILSSIMKFFDNPQLLSLNFADGRRIVVFMPPQFCKKWQKENPALDLFKS